AGKMGSESIFQLVWAKWGKNGVRVDFPARVGKMGSESIFQLVSKKGLGKIDSDPILRYMR
ncbi:MAG TPA: hypothetical protein PKJ72_09010, partial [Deltaproteobacteria bacterium]|nr:hypothetical protein [Deltaproteobacteria bacterium]